MTNAEQRRYTRVATPERFELPTYGIEIHCSIQLSYGAVVAGETGRAAEL